MRLHSAALQTPIKSSVPPGLPLHNLCPRLTHSESTLPQLLIPLHFNSPRINTYKKNRRGCPPQNHKVSQLVTPSASSIWSRRNVCNPNPFIHLRTLFVTPRGTPPLCHLSRLSSPARVMGHGSSGPPVPLRRDPQSARMAKLAESSIAARKHLRSSRCLI